MTNTVHNIVHLLLGAILLVMAYQGNAQAALGMKIVGVVYLLVAVLGFVAASPLLGLVVVNTADNWLHVVLGAVLLGLGLMKISSETSAM